MDHDTTGTEANPRGASRSRDVIVRCKTNPLIGLTDLSFRAGDIWNAGVTWHDGRCLLLITIETLKGHCAIYRAYGDDGVFEIDAKPFMAGSDAKPDSLYEQHGIRDPRITSMEDAYYIAYVAEGNHGQRVGLARTTDFRTVERIGYPTQVDVKNGALFPRKINGRYVLLERPSAGESIWLTYSRDLSFWGDYACVMTPRGGFWDSHRIGASAPPIEIDEGWLLIYYGQKDTSAGPLVRLGTAILDRDDPSKVLARSNIPILSPREKYERIGDVPNVVFSCGALLNGDVLDVYYGASDSCICRGSAPLRDIVRTCFESNGEF